MCTQFIPKDKLDPMENCGTCDNFKNNHCIEAEKIKHEIQLERCDICNKPAADLQDLHGCYVCGECRTKYNKARKQIAVMAYAVTRNKLSRGRR